MLVPEEVPLAKAHLDMLVPVKVFLSTVGSVMLLPVERVLSCDTAVKMLLAVVAGEIVMIRLLVSTFGLLVSGVQMVC